MELKPSLNPKKTESAKESSPIYKAFQSSIKTGHYKVQDLRVAHEQGLISREEYNLLVSEQAERLEKMVGIDPLTKLFDRTFLKPKLDGAIRGLNEDRDKRKFPIETVAVIYFDITNFKSLNDKYGHTVGDEALIVVANRLRQETRTNDILFRLGGDEFLMILSSDMDSGKLESLFEEKKKKINDGLSVEVNGANVFFSISMGLEVLHKGESKTAEEIIKTADKKMYEDKKRRPRKAQ